MDKIRSQKRGANPSRSIRFPSDLVDYIERAGRENERKFSRQVIYMLRRQMAGGKK